MKKCEYCAKEISYHEMYCCDECQNSAFAFYDKRDKFTKFFSIVNGALVLNVGICFFLYALIPTIAVIAGGASLTILGVMYMFLPFPPEIFIEKQKLKKAVFITRIIAAVVLATGIGVLIYGIITAI